MIRYVITSMIFCVFVLNIAACSLFFTKAKSYSYKGYEVPDEKVGQIAVYLQPQSTSFENGREVQGNSVKGAYGLSLTVTNPNRLSVQVLSLSIFRSINSEIVFSEKNIQWKPISEASFKYLFFKSIPELAYEDYLLKINFRVCDGYMQNCSNRDVDIILQRKVIEDDALVL